MVKGLYIMNQESFELVYPIEVRNEIGKLADIYKPPLTSQQVMQDPSVLNEAEVIFSGWGGPKLDKEFLDAAPHFKVLFYAAGTIKHIATDYTWEKDIVITNAAVANAIPVAEYALSQILFTLKNGWQFALDIKQIKQFPKKLAHQISGGFGSTVGLISLSIVGRKVNEYLQPFDVKVLAYDPFVSEEEAAKLNVELCTLEDIFKRSDVVSLHAPLLEETKGLITGDHIEMMKPYSSFINTARGAIVKETEMVDVLQDRSDITAILDVTAPEPPVAGSPLYTLPNVILTPHMAGSEAKECGRMGTYMLEEFKRFLNKERLQWQISRQTFDRMA